MSATGCISIGTKSGARIDLDHVIECVYIDPATGTCTIFVIIFVQNTTAEDQHLHIIHRGSLRGSDVTMNAWEGPRRTWAQVLAHRVLDLHADNVRYDQGMLHLGTRAYHLWHGPAGVIPAIVGNREGQDVPFTLWELGPIPTGKALAACLLLEMTEASYKKQVGDPREFYAYGDAILLDIIEYQDLPAFDGADSHDYKAVFHAFRTSRRHLVPAVFEWLLVSPDGTRLPWVTTPLSANFSPQVIPDAHSATTKWFVANYPQAREFRIRGELPNDELCKDNSSQDELRGGELSNAFALKVKEVPVGMGCD